MSSTDAQLLNASTLFVQALQRIADKGTDDLSSSLYRQLEKSSHRVKGLVDPVRVEILDAPDPTHAVLYLDRNAVIALTNGQDDAHFLHLFGGHVLQVSEVHLEESRLVARWLASPSEDASHASSSSPVRGKEKLVWLSAEDSVEAEVDAEHVLTNMIRDHQLDALLSDANHIVSQALETQSTLSSDASSMQLVRIAKEVCGEEEEESRRGRFVCIDEVGIIFLRLVDHRGADHEVEEDAHAEDGAVEKKRVWRGVLVVEEPELVAEEELVEEGAEETTALVTGDDQQIEGDATEGTAEADAEGGKGDEEEGAVHVVRTASPAPSSTTTTAAAASASAVSAPASALTPTKALALRIEEMSLAELEALEEDASTGTSTNTTKITLFQRQQIKKRKEVLLKQQRLQEFLQVSQSQQARSTGSTDETDDHHNAGFNSASFDPADANIHSSGSPAIQPKRSGRIADRFEEAKKQQQLQEEERLFKFKNDPRKRVTGLRAHGVKDLAGQYLEPSTSSPAAASGDGLDDAANADADSSKNKALKPKTKSMRNMWEHVLESSKSTEQTRVEHTKSRTIAQFTVTRGTGIVKRRIDEWEELFVQIAASAEELESFLLAAQALSLLQPPREYLQKQASTASLMAAFAAQCLVPEEFQIGDTKIYPLYLLEPAIQSYLKRLLLQPTSSHHQLQPQPATEDALTGGGSGGGSSAQTTSASSVSSPINVSTPSSSNVRMGSHVPLPCGVYGESSGSKPPIDVFAALLRPPNQHDKVYLALTVKAAAGYAEDDARLFGVRKVVVFGKDAKEVVVLEKLLHIVYEYSPENASANAYAPATTPTASGPETSSRQYPMAGVQLLEEVDEEAGEDEDEEDYGEVDVEHSSVLREEVDPGVRAALEKQHHQQQHKQEFAEDEAAGGDAPGADESREEDEGVRDGEQPSKTTSSVPEQFSGDDVEAAVEAQSTVNAVEAEAEGEAASDSKGVEEEGTVEAEVVAEGAEEEAVGEEGAEGADEDMESSSSIADEGEGTWTTAFTPFKAPRPAETDEEGGEGGAGEVEDPAEKEEAAGDEEVSSTNATPSSSAIKKAPRAALFADDDNDITAKHPAKHPLHTDDQDDDNDDAPDPEKHVLEDDSPTHFAADLCLAHVTLARTFLPSSSANTSSSASSSTTLSSRRYYQQLLSWSAADESTTGLLSVQHKVLALNLRDVATTTCASNAFVLDNLGAAGGYHSQAQLYRALTQHFNAQQSYQQQQLAAQKSSTSSGLFRGNAQQSSQQTVNVMPSSVGVYLLPQAARWVATHERYCDVFTGTLQHAVTSSHYAVEDRHRYLPQQQQAQESDSVVHEVAYEWIRGPAASGWLLKWPMATQSLGRRRWRFFVLRDHLLSYFPLRPASEEVIKAGFSRNTLHLTETSTVTVGRKFLQKCLVVQTPLDTLWARVPAGSASGVAGSASSGPNGSSGGAVFVPAGSTPGSSTSAATSDEVTAVWVAEIARAIALDKKPKLFASKARVESKWYHESRAFFLVAADARGERTVASDHAEQRQSQQAKERLQRANSRRFHGVETRFLKSALFALILTPAQIQEEWQHLTPAQLHLFMQQQQQASVGQSPQPQAQPQAQAQPTVKRFTLFGGNNSTNNNNANSGGSATASASSASDPLVRVNGAPRMSALHPWTVRYSLDLASSDGTRQQLPVYAVSSLVSGTTVQHQQQPWLSFAPVTLKLWGDLVLLAGTGGHLAIGRVSTLRLGAYNSATAEETTGRLSLSPLAHAHHNNKMHSNQHKATAHDTNSNRVGQNQHTNSYNNNNVGNNRASTLPIATRRVLLCHAVSQLMTTTAEVVAAQQSGGQHVDGSASSLDAAGLAQMPRTPQKNLRSPSLSSTTPSGTSTGPAGGVEPTGQVHAAYPHAVHTSVVALGLGRMRSLLVSADAQGVIALWTLQRHFRSPHEDVDEEEDEEESEKDGGEEDEGEEDSLYDMPLAQAASSALPAALRPLLLDQVNITTLQTHAYLHKASSPTNNNPNSGNGSQASSERVTKLVFAQRDTHLFVCTTQRLLLLTLDYPQDEKGTKAQKLSGARVTGWVELDRALPDLQGIFDVVPPADLPAHLLATVDDKVKTPVVDPLGQVSTAEKVEGKEEEGEGEQGGEEEVADDWRLIEWRALEYEHSSTSSSSGGAANSNLHSANPSTTGANHANNVSGASTQQPQYKQQCTLSRLEWSQEMFLAALRALRPVSVPSGTAST